MKINAVCLLACLLASVTSAVAAEQHLVDSPVLMNILKTVDEAPTDEHLLDVTLRLLKGICECMTETLLVKQERTNHADTSAIPYTPSMDGATRNTTWKEFDLYQKIYNNTCFNLRNELAVKVDVDQLERTKNENDTQSSLKTWSCGKQHEITTERIVMASTNMSPVLDDSLRPQLDNVLFKTLIITKDHHTYKLRRRSLFGKNIPVTRNKKKHSIIVIVTLHPPQSVSRNGKVPSENVGSISEINRNKLDEMELNRTMFSKSPVDIDIFDTNFNLTEKESDENNKNEVPKCVLLSIYKFLTESEAKNNTKVFKLLRRKKSIKIYIEVMTSLGDGNYSGMCCDGDAITTSCTQQYIAKHLDIDNSQDYVQNRLKQKTMPKNEERNSDYKDTVAKIKNLLKLYDNELQKSTYFGKRVNVDNKLEGPKHGGHVDGDAHASVIDIFAKHKSVADHVTKSTNIDKMDKFTTQIFSTTASSIQDIYTFKGFYDDELWDNTIPQETKTTDSTINVFQSPVPTKSNLYFLNLKKYPSEKEHIINTIKREYMLPKGRTTRSTETNSTFEMGKLSDTISNSVGRLTDEIHETMNPYSVIPLKDSLVLSSKKNASNQTTGVEKSTEYLKADKGSKIASSHENTNLSRTSKNQYSEIFSNFQTGIEKSNKIDTPSEKNLSDKTSTITSMTSNNKLISKERLDFETDNENVFKNTRELKTSSDFIESFTEDSQRSTQTSTINVQQKSSDSSNNYLSQITESSRIKQNDINARIYKTTKSYAYETSTEFNYDTTVHNSQDDMDSNKKYKQEILNSIIKSIHPQQFTDYKNIVDPTMDKNISKDSLLLNNFVTSTLSPDIRIDSSSTTTMEPSGEYIDLSSDSGEKHVNKSFETHSNYEDSKRLSVNLFESMIPLEPIIAPNNVSENEHFTTDYETLAQKTTESSVKLSDHHFQDDLSKKDDNLINLTGSFFAEHTIKNITTKNMNPVTEIIDNNLSTTEDDVTISNISKDYMTPNLKHYIKGSFEYATTPVIVVTDNNNVFKKNADKMFQGNESGSKGNLDENEVHLKNSSDGSMLEIKNKIPVYLKEKSHVDLRDRVTSKTKYSNVEQLEFVTEPSEINESSNNAIIEEKLETTSPSIERTTVTTSENDGTITSNINLDEEKSDTITETNDSVTIVTGKWETTTENIETSSHDENIIKENSYGTTATTIDTTTLCMELPSDISTKCKEKGNLEEHSAATNRETPEITSERNQMDYLVETANEDKHNDSVDAPESHTSVPMSLKKVEPLVVERESSQIVELVSSTEKDTAGSENFDQLLKTNTLEPSYLTNVQPLLKNITSKPKNDLTSASEEVTVINKEDVQASESYTSTPTLALNVKPLVDTKGKYLSKLELTATTAPIALINAKHIMTGEEDKNDIDNTMTNTPENTGVNQMNASATDELLVREESARIPELHKPTPTSTHVELLVTSTDGKYINNSVSARDEWVAEHEEITTMTTLMQDTKFIRSLDTQDMKMVADTTVSTKQAEYFDNSVESGEKHVNKYFPIYSTYKGQKHPTAEGFQSPIEPITTSDNFTHNVNFTTNHQNEEVTESPNSVLFSGHPENMENVIETSLYTPNTKSKKSQNLADLHAKISPATKSIATKKPKTFHQVSEFDASTSNAESLVIQRERELIDSTKNKLNATDKGFVQDPKSYTIASTLSTNVNYLGTGKHEQQNNKLVSGNNKIPDNKEVTVTASLFEFDPLVFTIPMNVVPLFTNRTEELVNDSISATSMNVTLNYKDLVQAPESRTKDTVDIEMDSALEQIHTNNNKDSVESVIEKFEETSTIIAQGKELYSTLIYTTTSHPIESKATSILTSTQTTISSNDVITKKYATTDEQIGETHTKHLNSLNEKNAREENLITSTTDIDTVMKYYDAIQNNATLKSLESDTEETLFNEIEKEDSAENDRPTKGNLNKKTFNQKLKTTLRNSVDKLPTTTKHNLETSTDTLLSVRTILSSRDKSVNLDIKEDNSVETLIISTLPSFSEKTSSTDYNVKNNAVNEQFALRNSDMSTLVTDTLDYPEITPLYTPEIIHISELAKTANNIAPPNLEFRPGSQQLSHHEHVKNITNNLLLDYKKKSTDINGVVFPKTKQSIKSKSTNISDEKIITDYNSARNANIPPQISFNQSKKQDKVNDNEEKRISGTEPSIQIVTVNNSHSKLSQQTSQTFLFFIKNSESTQIRGTNFYPEGYNNKSLKQNTETEKVALELRSTTSTTSAQDISKVNEVTILKNDEVKSSDDWIKQDSSTNAELISRGNKPVSQKFKGQEGKEMNIITTLTLKDTTTAVRNSELSEFTKLINENEQVTLKDDIELGNNTKLKLKSKENIFEYKRYKYQEGKMPNVEKTVISEEILLTTFQNNLLRTETLMYPITTNSNIDKITNLAQERDHTTLKKTMEQFSGTKGEQDNNKNKLNNTDLKSQDFDHSYAQSTQIPQIITGGMSAIMEENLSEIETLSPPQFISEKSKENEIIIMPNKQSIHTNDAEEDYNTKSEIGSTENKSEYTKLNRQIDETLLALVTLDPHKTKEVNSEVNKITTLEQAALMNHSEENGETKTDSKGTGNKFEFTSMEDQNNKPYILSTITSEEIETPVKAKVNEITTLKNDTPGAIQNDNEQNRAIKVKLGDKRNESKHTNLKDLIETLEEISTFANKTTTSISTKLVNNLSKIETTKNVALGTGLPNYDEFILPLAVTKDFMNDSTAQEIKSEMNYVNEFTTLSHKSELVTPKNHIEQHSVNKAELESQEYKSNYADLKLMVMTTWRNENKVPMLENYVTQGSVIKTELEAKENKSEYRELNNQKSEKPKETFIPIAKKNSDVILVDVLKKLSKIETVSTVMPKETYLPNNYEFTLPVAVTENILYGLHTSTTEENRKEFYSEVNELMTLRDEDNPSSHKDRVKNSTKNVKFINQESEKNNKTFISAAKEITAGIFSKAVEYLPTIETETNVTEVLYYDKFTYPLAVTEDIVNAVAALTQEDIKLEVNFETNAINTWRNETYSVTPKDQAEQDKSKIQENDNFNSLSTFIPEEIKTEEKLELNKIITLVNENKTPIQQNQIEQNYGNNANLKKTKENKSTYTDFKNEQDERSKAIPTSVAQEITNTFAMVVEDLNEIETSTGLPGYLSTGIYNSDVLNTSEFTIPFLVTEDINTSKIIQKVTNTKMTTNTEQVNQRNLLHNSRVANNNEVNEIEIFPKTNFVIQGDFTGLSRIKSTLSSDIEKERNIGSFTFDYNKGNHEYTNHEDIASNIEVNSNILSHNNAQISFMSPSEEKNTESLINNKISTKSTTTQMQSFIRETVPHIISTETSFLFNNFVTDLPMLEDYYGTVPVTVNISPSNTKISTLPNLGEKTTNYIEDEKESFVITLPKPLLEKVKNTNHAMYEPRASDFDESHTFMTGEGKSIIANDILKIANTNKDSVMKKYKVSISALKQKIDHGNGTNTTTTLNKAEESVVFTDNLKLPEELLLQDTDTDNIQTNIVIKKPKTIGMKYPTLIYSPVSYLKKRLNTKNNNLVSNYDSLSDTNDSLPRKYSKEADEVLSELAAVLKSNCNITNRTSPSEMCYTNNVLTRIAQGNNNRLADDPVIAKSKHKNVSKSGATITSAAENTSFAAQQTSPVAEKIMSKDLTNLTHSDTNVTEVKTSKLITYAKGPNSSVNSEYTKDDDAFKKAIIIASAFKNLDILSKNSENTSLQKETKPLNAESSPKKEQFSTISLPDKAPKDSYSITVVANNKYGSRYLNDSKIYYVPFISNAAINKKTSEILSNKKDYLTNSLKQELSMANLKIDNVTSNNMSTAKSLDRKDNKIQSMSLTLDSNIKPQSYKMNKNLLDPIKSTQDLSIKERKTIDVNDKNIDIKIMKSGTISTTKTSEEVTSTKTNKFNKITESLTLNNTFNNSVLRLTDANLSSHMWKYESVTIEDDPNFLEKRVLLDNIRKKDEITNENTFYTTNSDEIKKYSKSALFNATESFVTDNVNLKRDKLITMDKILPSTVDVSTTVLKTISESSENNYAASRLTNFKTSVLLNKSTRALTKKEEFDHFRSKDNIHKDNLLNFNNTHIDNNSTKSKYVTPVLSHRYFPQLFAKTVLSKELKEDVTSPIPTPVMKQFSIVPDNALVGSVHFPVFTKATHEVTPVNTGTLESYFSQTNIQDLWKSLQDIIDTSANRDVNTIQANRSVMNVETTNTISHSSKSSLPAIEAHFNDHYGASSTEKTKLSRYSYKQIPEDSGKYKNIKHLFTNEEVIQNQSKKDITKGYVPIMTFTTTPKNTLITKPVGNIVKMRKMYKPSSRIGFDLYTTETDRQNVNTKPERRNDNSSLTNYTSNSKTNINKSSFSEANIESTIASKLTKKITNYDSVSLKAPEKEKNVLKPILKSKNINNSKLDIENAFTKEYVTKHEDKETVKNSTLVKHSSVVGNKYEHSAVADDMLRILVQATHSYPNIQPKAATERSTQESILYSLLSNKTITRSTKKITRHRNTIHPKSDDSTTTGPRRTTVRKKRRRTTKRIIYNTYEPTMYEDLDIAFTDDLQKQATQVKPTRANGEEILGDFLKSSDHVHIGDVTAILPLPVYFPTPSTTRQVNVRGKIELAHIIRQTKIKNTESASNKSMNSVANTDLKIKPRPTRLPAFNNLYKNYMDATERMISLPETHIDSVPVIVSNKGPKPTRLVNFNHYETIITTEPTRLLENGIQNSIENPVQSKQFIYRNGPGRNEFTGTLLPPETSKPRKRNIHRSVMRKAKKKLTFYQGLGKIYEKPTHFPIFGDVYQRTAYFTKNVKNPVIYDNIVKAATNENNIAEDKFTAFMKATRSSNKKILLFRKNDPRLSKINQIQTKQLMSDITYPPAVKQGPTARFAVKQFPLAKKNNYKMSMDGKNHLRAKFVPSNLEIARTTDSNVDFTVKDLITTDAQKSPNMIKNIINKPQRIMGMLLDPLDPRIKTKLYPVKVIPKYKVKKVYHSAAENNVLTENPKEFILDNMNRMATARIHFFDELTRNNKKTYIVHSAKPSLSRQILLRPKFANIDNAIRITQVPPIEKSTYSKLIPIEMFENRMPMGFNLAHNNKKQIRRLVSNIRDNNLNILEDPIYFPLMNKKARGNSETKYGMSTRGFLVPEEKYFLERPMESFREAAIPMPPPTPYSRYQMHPVTPSKPRRSRRTIFFLSPTASYIEYFK